MPKHILIVVGDPSADRHGAALAAELRRRDPGLKISALGGAHLRREAQQWIYPLVDVGGFGFLEPLIKIPRLYRVYRRIVRLLESDPPDLVIPMDYYGFNIHVAEAAAKRRIPVLYYISPQVWASRAGRVQRLGKAIKRMLVIFPFEKKIYSEAGVSVRYVGHPLIETLPEPDKPPLIQRIGLLPGSRPATVRRHLPIMAAVADRLHQQFPNSEFIFFRPEELSEELYRPFTQQRLWIRTVCDPFYEERRRLTMALSVSGTAALENTLLGIPMVIMYRLSTMTYWVARALIKVPYVGIPNILAKRLIVPEVLQEAANPENLSHVIEALLKDPAKLSEQRRELLSLREAFGKGGTKRAADEILSMLGKKPETHSKKGRR